MSLLNGEDRGVQVLHWMYYIGGGIYVSEEFSFRTKWFWFALNLWYVMVFTLSGIAFFITNESFNWLDILILFPSYSAVIYCAFLFPSITIYHHRDIVNLIRFIKHAPKIATRRTLRKFENESVDRSFEKTYFWLNVVTSVISMGALTVPAISLVFRPDAVESLGRLEHHLMGLPYVDRIYSLELYFGIYLFEFLCGGFFMMIVVSELLFLNTVAYELDRIVALYREDMRAFGEIFAHRIESGEGTAMLCHRFDVKLSSFIRKHQNMMRSFRLIGPYFRIFSTFMLPVIFLFSASQMFIFLLTNFDFSLKLRLLTHTTSSQLFYYLHCKFGTTLDSMREDIVREVYNLPWYYLTPSQRKKFYIFLDVAQRPITFKVLKIYPVNMSLFPNILRLAYSYVSALYIYTVKRGR